MRIRNKKMNKDFIILKSKEQRVQWSNLYFGNYKVYENQIKYKFLKLLSQHQTKQGN